ncbi:MAG: hypothetical protein AAGE05_14870 [Pseudomonadota bacterium]
MQSFCKCAGAALALILATPVNAQESASAALSPLAMSDFTCALLIGLRRNALLEREDVDTAQGQARLVELNILTAFFNGRVSQYEANDRVSTMRQRLAAIRAFSAEQVGTETQRCTDFYLNARQTIMNEGVQAEQLAVTQ